MTIVAGTCKECGGDVMVETTRTDPNFHDCKCHGCGREVSIPWGTSVSTGGEGGAHLPSRQSQSPANPDAISDPKGGQKGG